MIDRFKYLVLFILPLLFLIFGLTFQRPKYTKDPEYIYLINALNIHTSRPVYFTDNPGTTVIESTFIIQALIHLFDRQSGEDMEHALLKDPDKYVQLTRIVWIVLNTILLLIIGFQVYRKTNELVFALIVQLTPFLSTNLMEHVWIRLSPEPLLFFSSLLMSLLIISYIYSQNKDQIKYIVLFSLVTGFGLATKITFIPILAIPLILLDGIKRKVLYLGFSLLAFVLFTLPVIHLYKDMFGWFYNLLVHSGIYGKGKGNFIEANTYFPNLFTILVTNHFLTVVVCLSVFVLIWGRIRNGVISEPFTRWLLKIQLAILIAIAMGILLVAKHYHTNHYLLPELSFMGMCLALFLLATGKLLGSRRIVRMLGYLFLLAVIVVGIFWYVPDMKKKNSDYRNSNMEYDKVLSIINEQYAGYQSVYLYPHSTNKFSALKFGDIYARQKHLLTLKQLYPQVLFYEQDKQVFTNWKAELIPEEVIELFSPKLLLIGRPMSETVKSALSKLNIGYKEVYKGNLQAIYELFIVFKEKNAFGMPNNIQFQIRCNADTLSADLNHFVSGGHLFGGAHCRSPEKARSGNFSVKLDSENKYAMEYKIKGVQPGDRYKVSVWSYSDYCDGHLVASSDHPDVFYKAMNDYIRSDSTGWKQISFYFSIPPESSGETITIILWNAGPSTVYFDDLEISLIND
jgi:hypothetical protein